jgi:long-chain acyl-CoA synthetase
MNDFIPMQAPRADRPWFASYPPGVPREIDLAKAGTINELFDRAVRDYANRTVIDSFGVGLTYARLAQVAWAVASWLQANGIKPGDRVAIMMPNVAAYMPVVFGILKAGGIVVNVNPLYTAHELRHQLTDSGAKTIFVLAQFEHTVKQATDSIAMDHVVRVKLGDLLGLKGHLINYFGAKKTPIKRDGRIKGAVDFATVVEAGGRRTFKPVAVAPSDLAFIQYTGGTTGVAKGAALRHCNLTANLEQIAAWFAPSHGHAEGEFVMVSPLPLYHIYALTVSCLYVVSHGGLALLIANPRDLPAFIKTLKSRRFTMFAGLNTLYNSLADTPGIRSVDFSHLTVSLAGGMATQRAVADKWQAITGKPIIEGYGLSETSPMISLNFPDNTTFTGTVGYPWPSTDVSLRGNDGAEVPTGDVGEVCVKGPQVMAGYWNRPDETAKAMTADGYFRTGDLAILLPDGQMKLVDRLKEMIIVSGFNVYPNEIEDVIVKHPKVREAAVIGLPDPHSGECVCAYIVRRDDTLTADEVRAFCSEQLTKYKVPKIISFRADLPKSPVGKVLRRVLRDDVMASIKPK